MPGVWKKYDFDLWSPSTSGCVGNTCLEHILLYIEPIVL